MLQFTLTAATVVWMSYIIITLIIIHVTTLFIIIIHVSYNTYYHTCVIHVLYMCYTCVIHVLYMCRMLCLMLCELCSMYDHVRTATG